MTSFCLLTWDCDQNDHRDRFVLFFAMSRGLSGVCRYRILWYDDIQNDSINLMLVSIWNALICRYQNNSNKLVSDCFRGFFAHFIIIETKFDLHPLSYKRWSHCWIVFDDRLWWSIWSCWTSHQSSSQVYLRNYLPR